MKIKKIGQLKSITISKKNQILITSILGIVIFLSIGILPIEILHNAAHDARHTIGFPCH